MNPNGPSRGPVAKAAWLQAGLLLACALLPWATQAQDRAATAAENTAPANLISAYVEALKNNAEFRAQLASTRAVAELENVAEGRLRPQLGLGASYGYGYENVQGDFYSAEGVNSEDQYSNGLVGVKLRQPLYQPDLWISRDQASLKLSQSRFALEQSEDQLLIDVVAAYLGVLAAQDARRLAQAETAAVERQLEQVRGRGAAGLELEADVLAAKAQYSTALAELIQADGLLDTAISTLDLTTGVRLRNLKVLPEGMVLKRPEPADPQSWVARAREQNLDVIAARISAQIAGLDAEKARYARRPKVDATGSASYVDLSGGISGERTEKEARIGVDVSLPLYSGGSISAAIAAAEASFESAQALVDAAQAKAERDARVAYTALFNSLNKVPARWDAVLATRSAESATTAGYEAGTRTNAEVLRTVEERYDAERAYSTSRYDYMLDSLRLKFAAGNLANVDLSQFDRLLRPAGELR